MQKTDPQKILATRNDLTVAAVATELGLWPDIVSAITQLSGRNAVNLRRQLALVSIRRSRALRSLGSYCSRAGKPVCIRLQFAQEPENLRQTLLHELAHCCDHLERLPGQPYRQAHGPGWQRWVTAFGGVAEVTGRSESLRDLHRQRVKLVAVCQRCGAQILRVRRLNRRGHYQHAACGGRLRPV